MDWLIELFYVIREHDIKQVTAVFKNGSKGELVVVNRNEFQYRMEGGTFTSIVVDD